MKEYIIETSRLGLRRWIDSDTEPFAEMSADAAVMKYFLKKLNYEETLESIKRINEHFEKNGFGIWVVEDKTTKAFLGIAGLAIPFFESFFTPCVEIGWRFKKEFWGKGFATEAGKACLHYGFNELQLEKIVSFTSVLNTKSEMVMKRIGMKYATPFAHPNIDRMHILNKHVLYEINRNDYAEIKVQ
jgi:ribosomal-protein-alanine N-acetyltransferase